MEFRKYHGLGNDYLVLDPSSAGCTDAPGPDLIRRLCQRHFGVGADGILWGPLAPDSHLFPDCRGAPRTEETASTAGEIVAALRIYNSDGSEAEKSGNGLRIFARYLWDTGAVGTERFCVLTLGGRVACQVMAEGRVVRVAMGRVSFRSDRVPMQGPVREVLGEPLQSAAGVLEISAATVGNPHCVVHCETVSEELARRLGPELETHPLFPERTNVQFLTVLDRANIRIEIWERGAGYTLASGTSACAAAAVAHRRGACDAEVAVHMPGGCLQLSFDREFEVVLSGSVGAIATGVAAPELLRGPPRSAAAPGAA